MSYLSARTAAALLASATLVAAYGVGAAGADAPRETRAHAPANAAQASHAGGFAGAIDTTDRDAVGRAYKARFESNLATPIHWTGSNAHCRPGHMSARARAATLESINFVRAMGGLAPVSFSTALSAKAQKAALIMSAQRSLSHDPPRSWRCWTPPARPPRATPTSPTRTRTSRRAARSSSTWTTTAARTRPAATAGG